MGKYANSGEMKTPVIVEKYTSDTTSNGYPLMTWENIFGENKSIRAKWVNIHGTEVFEAMGLDLKEPATLTMRYSPMITKECRILKEADKIKADETLYYEIISIDNIEEKNTQIEIKVQRKRSAR